MSKAGDTEAAFNEMLGRNVWRKREQRGLSRATLAAEVGVHRNTIERWELGEGEIGLWMLLRIADKLNVNHLVLLPDREFTWGRQLKMAVRERDLPLSQSELRLYGMKL